MTRKAKTRRTTGQARGARLPDVPRSFVAFAAWVGVELSPAQRVVGAVAFDGVQPRDLGGDDRELAAQLFGPGVETVPEDARGVVNAVCGGRAGKSYVLVALRLVHGMLVRDLSPIAPGQRAAALVVAPNETLRQEVTNYALGIMRMRPDLEALVVLPKGTKPDAEVSWFGVRRPDFKRVVKWIAGVATEGGYGGRGKSFTDAALDEAAFFRDSSAKVNDRDIFTASSSRVLPGGQAIVASTPWARGGLLYDLHAENWENPTTALAIHAPTLLMNPSDWTRIIVERAYKRDPDTASREFGAEFLTGGTTTFFDPMLLQSANDNTVWTPDLLLPGDVVRAGGDFGFRSDSSALVIVVLRAGVLHVVSVLEVRPEHGKPLKPSVVVAQFAEELRRWGIAELMADQHYRESIVEHLDTHNLAYVPAPHTPAEAYITTRQRLRGETLKLPPVPRLVQQLREVQGRPQPGGTMSIILPRWRTGGHGDIVSAFVLAVHQHGGETVEKPKAEPGSTEWEEELRERRRREVEERLASNGLEGDRSEQAWWRGVG